MTILLGPRAAVRVAAAAMLLSLVGCGSVLDSGIVADSDGATTSAVSYMNTARLSNGLAPTAPDAKLERAALQQARYMAEAGKMKHTTRNGRDFLSRVKANDIEGTAAENVAYGAMDVGRAMKMWLDSPPHRRNMLDPRFGHFGVASATDGKGKRYWAMVLGE